MVDPTYYHCQVDETLDDRPPRDLARARRELAMLGIGNGRQPQLDNTGWSPTSCVATPRRTAP